LPLHSLKELCYLSCFIHIKVATRDEVRKSGGTGDDGLHEAILQIKTERIDLELRAGINTSSLLRFIEI
jgi:hypothetical protein